MTTAARTRLWVKSNPPRIRQLFEDWDERKRGNPFPGWDTFDPIDLKYILGNLVLLDVEPGAPYKSRYRVYGSKVTAQRGCDLTGRYVDDVPPADRRAFLNDNYSMIAESGSPHHAIRYVRQDGRKFHHEILSLPLASDDRTVDKILVAVVPIDRSIWL